MNDTCYCQLYFCNMLMLPFTAFDNLIFHSFHYIRNRISKTFVKDRIYHRIYHMIKEIDSKEEQISGKLTWRHNHYLADPQCEYYMRNVRHNKNKRQNEPDKRLGREEFPL